MPAAAQDMRLLREFLADRRTGARSRGRPGRRGGGRRRGWRRPRTALRAAPRRRSRRPRRRPGRSSRREAPKASRISSCSAGRKSSPSASRSFISLSRSSPRTSASTTRPSATTGIAFAVARGSTPRNSETASIVRWPGVSTSCGSGSSSGKSGARRPALRDLEVGRVVAVLAGHERVLARPGRRQEVLAAAAAHHPGLRRDLVAPRSRSARRSACTPRSACGSSRRARPRRGRTSSRPS